jgi:hypothetical protein
LEGGPTDDAVDREAGVALEFGQRASGVIPEDAVDAPGVEAEGAQTLLELGNVVTAQHRPAEVEKAVADSKTGFDQGVPGLATADTVDPEAAQPLKGLKCGARRRPEDAVGLDRRPREDGCQAVLDVRDRVAAIPDGERQAYR